jgi:hypothetical protein
MMVDPSADRPAQLAGQGDARPERVLTRVR